MSSCSRMWFVAGAVVGALVLGAVPAAAAEKANTGLCGGRVADYVGARALDAAFTGTVNRGGTGDRPMTVTPVAAGENLLSTTIDGGPSDHSTITYDFAVVTRTSGQSAIAFDTPWGRAYGLTVQCTAGTRVTKITGFVKPASGEERITFLVGRV